MLDDVLDVSGPVERTGKARGTDLLDGTVTLPFILAREHAQDLASIELRRSFYVEGEYARGGSTAERGWSIDTRVSF